MANSVEERIKKWKDKLIDLSKRNRLLNFRPTKKSTIKVTGELPSEILNILVVQEKEMEFFPTLPSEGSLFENSSLAENVSVEFQTYKADGLEEKHTDKYLQTFLSKEQLDKNLFHIYSKANSIMEEQGYNVLFLALGFLEWYESNDSDVKLKAPLLLVPVELDRTSVRGRFKLKINQEDQIIFNPALIAKLQNDFHISIDEIDDDMANLEPQRVFIEVKEKIKEQEKWRVTNDVYLGLFSFAKFTMYKDIEKFIKSLLDNSVIKMICGQPVEEQLQTECLLDDKELDKKINSSSTFQILDADSSQQKAILIAKNGENLVIEGPPGTGKSQTIANIIAEFLAADKKVLFVSQKMAALEVVKKRLDENGLGDFCLELHSRKVDRGAVIKELFRVLELTRKSDHHHDNELAKLEEIKEKLNAYVEALHTPYANLEMTPYQAFGTIAKLSETLDMPFSFEDARKWDRKRYEDTCELLENFAHNSLKIGNPVQHSWYGSSLSKVHYQDKLKLIESIKVVNDFYFDVQRLIQILAKQSFFNEPLSINNIKEMIEANEVLINSPAVGKSILENPRWNSISAEISNIIDTIKSFNTFEEMTKVKYNTRNIISGDIDIDSIIARYARYAKSLLFFLNVSFWKDRKKIRSYLVDKKYKPRRKDVLNDLNEIKIGFQLAQKITNSTDLGKELFGDLWQGLDTTWNSLEDFSKWVVKFRYYAIKNFFNEAIFIAVSERKIDAEDAKMTASSLMASLNKFEENIKLFLEQASIDELIVFEKKFTDVATKDLMRKINHMKDTIEYLDDWSRYQNSLRQCESAGLKKFIDKVSFSGIVSEEIIDIFRCQFLKSWLDSAFSERIHLNEFYGEDHQSMIGRFCELDRKQIELAKIRIQHRLSGKLATAYSSTYTPSKNSELGILLREARKMKAFMSIRKLFSLIPRIIADLKPCLMMSPLTVAQFLNPEQIKFDLVIFDEASQIPPEDSVGAILRGKQVVVAGDSKQLPPTTFFQSEVMVSEDDDEENGELQQEDLSSILDECAVSGIRRAMLQWHYRSKHESLIAFSNKSFYDGRLLTFPCAEEQGLGLGVKFNYNSQTIYDRGRTGVNIEEAREVAKAVFNHFREHPESSLGVGTFSIRQKYAIEETLEQMLREDNSLEVFFAKNRHEHFFVKNLETIQGDERDIIFVSVGYGKDKNNRLPMNFGPINQNGGERRLNVLVTRAKKRIEIFTSIKGDDFDLSKTDSMGVHLLKNYLDYAEKGHPALLQDYDGDGELESPFEESVYDLLILKGYKVRKQVGCSGYRIDLAVVDSENPGKYILGIECDGACYHSSSTARDRDRLRQQVLEQLNWKIYRIWSTDWFKNTRAEIEKLIDMIEQAKKREFPKKKVENSPEPQIKYKNICHANKEFEITSYSRIPILNKYQSDFYNGISKICSVLEKVVQYEGPIHRKEALRRVAQHWGFRSIGSRIMRILKQTELACIRNKMIIKQGEFYWPSKIEKINVRRRSGDELKEFKFICPEEIGQAALIVLRREYSIPLNELIQQTVYLLGFERATDDIKKYTQRVIEGHVQNNKIVEIDNKLVLPKETIVACSSCGQKLRFPNKTGVVTCPICKNSFRTAA